MKAMTSICKVCSKDLKHAFLKPYAFLKCWSKRKNALVDWQWNRMRKEFRRNTIVCVHCFNFRMQWFWWDVSAYNVLVWTLSVCLFIHLFFSGNNFISKSVMFNNYVACYYRIHPSQLQKCDEEKLLYLSRLKYVWFIMAYRYCFSLHMIHLLRHITYLTCLISYNECCVYFLHIIWNNTKFKL